MKFGHAVGIACAGLLCVAVALGQDIKRLTPQVESLVPARIEEDLLGRADPVADEAGTGEIFLDRLRGLVVTLDDAESSLDDGGGAAVLNGEIRGKALLQSALSAFVGKPLAASTFPAIAETIVAHFERYDRPVVEISFPEQDITDGVLQVDIAEGRFGHLKISGGANWDVENLSEQLELPKIVSEAAILQELDWLNENRLRKARVSVSEGLDGTTDVDFQLSDDRTWRAFSGYENSGVSLLGEDRFFVGLETGNVFNRGHQMTYQYFTDDSLDRYQAHALSYRVPIGRLRHIVSLTAAIVESDVALEDVGGLSRSNGSSWLASVSYKIPLRRSRNLKHSMAFGFEYKSSNNDFEFGGGEALDTPTEVMQAGIAYDAEIRSPFGLTALDLDLKWSPGEMSDRNSDDAFAMLRPGTESDYLIGSAEIETTRALGAGFDMSLGARGQWAGGAALIPSEQLAFGGYDGIRGYEERETLGDAGFVLSAEVYTPVVETSAAGLRGLVFIDYGVANDEVENESAELASYGAGLRIQVSEKAAVRFDYGWQIESGEGRGHVGVVVEF